MAEQDIEFYWVDIYSGSHKLVGRVFKPNATAERIIVINAATGIRQHYYEAFARWLSNEHNALVLTYDYYAFGLSRTSKPIQCSRISMSDWGINDQDAALTFACKSYPDLPVWVIGHSLGGLMLRWHKYRNQVERYITVASGPINTKDHPIAYLPFVLWFWYVSGPTAVSILGYLNGKLSGLGSDIPAGVFLQWRRWCTADGFYENEIGSSMPTPPEIGSMGSFKAIAIEDDVMVPPVAVRRIDHLYQGIDIEHSLLKPSDFGLKRVGHYKVFSAACAAMWPAIVA